MVERHEYSLVDAGDTWEVHVSDRRNPVAVYRDPDHALAYIREAARQRSDLDGVELDGVEDQIESGALADPE